MENNPRLEFPFTVRDMLAFQHGANFALKIVSQSISASPLVIRGMTSEGPFSFVHIPTNNSVIATETFGLSDIPIMVSVQDKDQALVQGDTYATLTLQVNGDNLYELCSGLVYRQKSISYPTNSNVDMRPNGGRLLSKISADPAAGTELTLTVPAGQIWRVLGFDATLVTDGTVSNRVPHFKFNLDGQLGLNLVAQKVQAASATQKYSVHAGTNGLVDNDDNDTIVNMPENIIMMPADTITTQTTNFQAGDNWGTLKAWVEMYFNPA